MEAVYGLLGVDRGVTGDIHRHIANQTAADARSTLAAGGIVHLGVVGDGHRTSATETTAANACTVLLSSGGDGAAGDLLDLFVEHLHRRLGLDDVVADEHAERN